jgi:Na+-driven multidrug efflux pump
MVFLGFYFVGHPMSVLFGFYFELGITGLLLGFICGSFAMGLLFYFALTVRCDWEKNAYEIRKKMMDNQHE